MKEKIEFIDDFLMRCEDWMHGQDGEDVTKCRKYLIEIRGQVKNCSIPIVVGRSEQLPCGECSGNGGGVTDNGWEKCDCQK